MNTKEYNRLRYNRDYLTSTAHRVRAAANLLRKLGCTITFPEDFEENIAAYAETCPRRERLDIG